MAEICCFFTSLSSFLSFRLLQVCLWFCWSPRVPVLGQILDWLTSLSGCNTLRPMLSVVSPPFTPRCLMASDMFVLFWLILQLQHKGWPSQSWRRVHIIMHWIHVSHHDSRQQLSQNVVNFTDSSVYFRNLKATFVNISTVTRDNKSSNLNDHKNNFLQECSSWHRAPSAPPVSLMPQARSGQLCKSLFFQFTFSQFKTLSLQFHMCLSL